MDVRGNVFYLKKKVGYKTNNQMKRTNAEYIEVVTLLLDENVQ